MARGPYLMNRHQDAVAVAINAEIDQLLGVTARGAFDPELLPRARPIGHVAGFKRSRDSFGIHPGHHQHLTRGGILRDRRDQTGIVVPQCGRVERHIKNLCKRQPAPYLRVSGMKGNAMSAETDMIKLYSARILALAADMPRTQRLANPDATARKRAPLCGSTVTVDLTLADDVITDYGQDVKACALGQAAAAVVGANIVGMSVSQVQAARDALFQMLKEDGPVPPAPFDALEVLQPAKDYKNRHASIMLAFDAALDALHQNQASA